MSPSHAVKNGKRYRYYTSQALVKQQSKKAGSLSRIPAGEIENFVCLKIQELLLNEAELCNHIDHEPHETQYLIQQAQALATDINKTPSLLKKIVTKATLTDKDITVFVSQALFHKALDLPPPLDESTIELTEKMRLKRCQGEKKLCLENGKSTDEENINTVLIKAVSRGHVWNQMLIDGKVKTIKALAKQENISPRYVRRLLSLAFLPAQLIEDILAGKQAPNLCIDSLC
tara:strand:+ start:233 stop:925 length:693 start_codon:yes stop_codon:yes gene_type:complete